MYSRKHDIHVHTQNHDVETQFGAFTWAKAKAEKKNKDASGTATRRRNISCLTALRAGADQGRDETGNGVQIHCFEGLIGAPCDKSLEIECYCGITHRRTIDMYGMVLA